jgi:hypothetical protein
MADPETTTRVVENSSGDADASNKQTEPETTDEGALSFVGWVDKDAEKTSGTSGGASGDGPALSLRSTRKEPPNPVMAK